jgi:hypothetical protein
MKKENKMKETGITDESIEQAIKYEEIIRKKELYTEWSFFLYKIYAMIFAVKVLISVTEIVNIKDVLINNMSIIYALLTLVNILIYNSVNSFGLYDGLLTVLVYLFAGCIAYMGFLVYWLTLQKCCLPPRIIWNFLCYNTDTESFIY